MPHLLLVMAGGAIGAGLRFLVGRFTLHQFGPGFPWGTLTVNLAGGLAMGLLVGLLARFGSGGEGWRLFVGVGILGGFTTFSAFSLEVTNMIERGAVGLAAGYALVSVIGSVVALFAGLWLVRMAA
ncbi:fluoride efflux transporter CrcB [Parasphingopyxis lamellibrachiae]|uniref:Fluoride-specific ion channel FluC n=1 Tax=Parasphingopyxis lamellibrachiae TaxID=680125 RepID=A0A3D9FGL0_9SPHN|nr:fluoride efflux transporter CrcB [Parasphingopyxis lamellibrachiae]RED16929.1 camphor resistance protein CrcB [Parasphingopyxis lamellibrachiae]